MGDGSAFMIKLAGTFCAGLGFMRVVLGLVAVTFKVVAAVISVLVCFGFYNKLTEKN